MVRFGEVIFLKRMYVQARPMPFHDFTLFVVLYLFPAGSPNAGKEYSACVGETRREKREDNLVFYLNKFKMWSLFSSVFPPGYMLKTHQNTTWANKLSESHTVSCGWWYSRGFYPAAFSRSLHCLDQILINYIYLLKSVKF